MLVTFQCRACNDVTMFGDVAKTLLRMMGTHASVPGALHPDDIPLALHNLRNVFGMIAAHDNSPEEEAAADSDREVEVGLEQRAFPLIELMHAAHRERAHVIWDGR